jgi:hypothetical protein
VTARAAIRTVFWPRDYARCISATYVVLQRCAPLIEQLLISQRSVIVQPSNDPSAVLLTLVLNGRRSEEEPNSDKDKSPDQISNWVREVTPAACEVERTKEEIVHAPRQRKPERPQESTILAMLA